VHTNHTEGDPGVKEHGGGGHPVGNWEVMIPVSPSTRDEDTSRIKKPHLAKKGAEVFMRGGK